MQANGPHEDHIIQIPPPIPGRSTWRHAGSSQSSPTSLTLDVGTESIVPLPRRHPFYEGARSSWPQATSRSPTHESVRPYPDQSGSPSMGMSLDGMFAVTTPPRRFYRSREPSQAQDDFPEVVQPEHVDGPPDMERFPSESSTRSWPHPSRGPGVAIAHRPLDPLLFGLEGLQVASAEQELLSRRIEDAYAVDGEVELFNLEGKVIDGKRPGFLKYVCATVTALITLMDPRNVMTSDRKSQSGGNLYEPSRTRIFRNGSHLRIVTERQPSGMLESFGKRLNLKC